MERFGRFLGAFFGAFLCIVLLMGIYSIAEDITLTTYYPAPYGAYDELTTTGNTYLATTSGNVGIGTTASPNRKLEVKGDASFDDTVYIFDTQNTGFATGAQILTVGTGATNNTALKLMASGGITNYALIVSAGSVGIGTTIPNYPLDVAGDINTTGDVRKNGTAYTNPDYVFEPGYSLMSIADVKNYVF
ncbi:MAG: hypothetical protein Q7O04_06175, partial [Candidatus Omnitrophota bacterium]|nr:hypothetical protein [Candidatus Omnitrophota bacterium]